ncbi:MAG: hypothetical protein OHK0023_11680 [Anaerolineae bacterium]
MVSAPTASKTYCNCLALERGLSPIGHAGDFQDALVVETPLPWKPDFYTSEAVWPKQMRDLLALWLERWKAGDGYPHHMLAIAPDTEYSKPELRRVMHYTRQSGAISGFDKIEYHLPSSDVGALAWAIYEDRACLSHFETYRVPNGDQTREILVCTHGSVDTACSKFGYPLYLHARRKYANDGLRVWRVSHFGGHVFAPTLIDMPTGHYWAFVEAPQAQAILTRTGDVVSLRKHYRGWAGIKSGFMQAAEAEIWQRTGWEWFAYYKSAEMLAHEASTDEPTWAEVKISARHPQDDQITTYFVRVEISGYLETPTSTNKATTYKYPQYHVTKLEELS